VEDWLGEFGGVEFVYWAAKRVKSEEGVTVFPLIVTIPNCPCPLSAGK